MEIRNFENCIRCKKIKESKEMEEVNFSVQTYVATKK
jgi:hypothetical protein